MLPEKLRALAEQMEARGDWDEAKIIREAADAIIKHIATVKAYERSIERGVVINFKTGELLP